MRVWCAEGGEPGVSGVGPLPYRVPAPTSSSLGRLAGARGAPACLLNRPWGGRRIGAPPPQPRVARSSATSFVPLVIRVALELDVSHVAISKCILHNSQVSVKYRAVHDVME